VVYRAWQPSLGRQVALKCLLHSGDAKAEARFRREIRALGHVEHPHLVKVFTSGSDGANWFYAMELVEGVPLSALRDELQTRAASGTEVDLPAWQQTLAWQSVLKKEKPLSDPPAGVGSGGQPPAPVAHQAADGRRSPGGTASRDYVRHMIELMRQVAEAAHALHEAGVIHRDIKPDNILVSADGTQAFLMDLGLAQLADDVEGRVTRTREFVGTLRYASPQQVLAVGTLDRRTDVYSLGATLWELLALRPLYGAGEQTPTPELMERIQREEPQRLRRCHRGLPRDLEAVVHKCLEKDPARRYATARELTDDLGRYLAGEPVRARRVGRLERGWKWCRRHPWQAGLGVASALLVLLLVGGSVGLFFYSQVRGLNTQLQGALDDSERLRQEAQKQREEAEKQRDDAHEQRQEAERRKAEADRVGRELKKKNEEIEKKNEEIEEQKELVRRALFGAQMKFADLAWHQNRMADLRRILEPYRPRPGDDPNGKLRGFEWDSLWRLSEGDLPMLKVAKDSGQRVFISPDGRHLVVRGSSGPKPEELPVRLTPVGDRMSVEVSQGFSVVESVCFSPDGARLASASPDGKVKVWDTRTGLLLSSPEGQTKHASGVHWSPDGTLLASASWGEVKVWDARTGREERSLGRDGMFTSVCFSPDGKRLAAAIGNPRGLKAGEVRVWDVRNGREELSLKEFKGPVKSVCWSPDGARLACASEETPVVGLVTVWDARTGRKERSLDESPGHVNSVAWSPDGALFASGRHQTVAVWDARTGRQVFSLKGHTNFVTSVCFSPDGTRLASAADGQYGAGEQSGEVKLWDLRTGRESRTLKGHTCVCFSPDGTRLASAGDDGTMRLWDACTGEDALALNAHTGWARGVCFSPDGQRLATASSDRKVKVWDTHSGKEARTLEGHTGEVYSVCWSPDGTRLASAGGDSARKDGQVRVWDVRTGWEEQSLKGLKGSVHSVCWSPDGTRLATAGDDGTVKLWDAHTGREEASLKGLEGSVEDVCFSRDGTRLACASGFEVRVWDARTGKEQLSLKGQGGFVNCVCWSPDGQRLASGGALGTVQVWNAVTGEKSRPLEGHIGQVYRVCFSPDGARLASAGGVMQTATFTLDRKTGQIHDLRPGEGSHGEVKVWDPETGQELRSLKAPAGAVAASVCFAPDGNRLASGHSDGTVSIWEGKRDPKDIEPRWRVWQRQQAGECEKGGQWFAAAFYFRQLLKEFPDNATLKARLANALGNLHAEREQWAEAVVEFEKARQLQPHQLAVEYRLTFALLGRARASARAAAAASSTLGALSAPFNYSPLSAAAPFPWQGDLSDYRRICAELLHDFGRTADAGTADNVAFLCVLCPQAVKDPALPVQLARKAVDSDPDNRSYRETLGAALYRAGDFEAAVRELKRAVQMDRSGGSVEAKLFLAIAYHRLGRPKTAKDWFAQAAEQLREVSQPPSWSVWLLWQLLGEEAEALLQAAPQP
jgi:WD40 repeat protein/tetratricopeptide (TPR) repeat protein